MPDIACFNSEVPYPVEVKHLNNPRDEDVALSKGQMHGGSVDHAYHEKIGKKVEGFVNQSKAKFANYNALNGQKSDAGKIYLVYSQSIDASILDGVPWNVSMADHIKAHSQPLVTKSQEVEIIKLEDFFKES